MAGEPTPEIGRPNIMTPTTSPARRRKLLSLSIAATLAFTLAACGSEDDIVSAPGSTIDGTVESTIPGLRPPVPVEVAAGSTGANTSVASREMAPSSDMATSDMSMIAPYYISEFVLGDAFPALPTNNIGFVFDGESTLADEQITALAAAFGVNGDVVSTDQDGYQSWQVGPNDGTAPTIYVSGDAQLSWSFSPAWDQSANTTVSCEYVDPAVLTVDATGSTVTEPAPDIAVAPPGDVCAEPKPPANVPSADQAEALAVQQLTVLGVDSATVTLDTYADQWSASVTATVNRDGSPTGQTYSFGYGADSELQWAGGSLAVPAAVGPYELIDIDTALARLVEMNSWQGMAYPTDMLAIDAQMMGDVARGSAGGTVDAGSAVAGNEGSSGTTEPGTAPTPPVVAPMPVDTAPLDSVPVDTPAETVPVETMPVETYPAPEARTVTLVDVEADVWWAWDVNDVLWLLPAYRFIDTEGGWHVVPAVSDEFLIEVEQPVLETEPGVEPSEPVEEVVPDMPPEVDTATLDEFVGGPLDEFTKQAASIGLEVRVTERDGEALPVTMDYRVDRVNVSVKTSDGIEVVSAITGLN